MKKTNVIPLNGHVITTQDVYTKEEVTKNGLIVGAEGVIKHIQTVVAVAPGVTNVNVGDKVYINIDRYIQRMQKPAQIEGVKPEILEKVCFRTVELEDGNNYIIVVAHDLMYAIPGETTNNDTK